MKCLGIDIGGSSVKAALLDGGAVLWNAQSTRYSKPDASTLSGAIAETLKRHGPVTCDRVGMCVPGLFNAQSRSITLSVNVPGLVGIPLDQLLGCATGEPFPSPKIVNDALATAVDVRIAQQLSGRVLVLALGTGVGMAVLDDDQPLRLEGDSPGHMGQIDVSIETEPVPIGPDGGAGSLEGYIGVPALVARFGGMDRYFESVTQEDISLRALAKAIRIAHAIYRPDHVVLAGGVGVRLKRHLPELKQKIDQNLTSLARPGWKLRCAETDFHAAIGAARLAENDD